MGAETLGQRLSQARRELAVRLKRDIGQADVAEAIGASKASVSRWEADVDTPREAALGKLAAFLGVTPAFLRYGVGAPAVEQPIARGVLSPELIDAVRRKVAADAEAAPPEEPRRQVAGARRPARPRGKK